MFCVEKFSTCDSQLSVFESCMFLNHCRSISEKPTDNHFPKTVHAKTLIELKLYLVHQNTHFLRYLTCMQSDTIRKYTDHPHVPIQIVTECLRNDHGFT